MKKLLTICCVIAICFTSSGFWGGSKKIVAPTYEELQAAKAYKKSIAIVSFTEDGSAVKGIADVAKSKVEPLFVGHFNLIDSSEINKHTNGQVINEHDVKTIQELGEKANLDYLVFGNVISNVRGPYIENSSEKTSDGKFSGTITENVRANTEVALKIVDAKSGVVVYSDRKDHWYTHELREATYTDEKAYKESLQVRKISETVITLVEMFAKMEKEYSSTVAYTLKCAVEDFEKPIRRNFPSDVIEGEVLEIISEKKILVNLGSAYGVEPGDKFVFYTEQTAIKDPKTGLITFAKKGKKKKIKVKEVTSGLTCIVKGKKKYIKRLKVGDRVYTY